MLKPWLLKYQVLERKASSLISIFIAVGFAIELSGAAPWPVKYPEPTIVAIGLGGVASTGVAVRGRSPLMAQALVASAVCGFVALVHDLEDEGSFFIVIALIASSLEAGMRVTSAPRIGAALLFPCLAIVIAGLRDGPTAAMEFAPVMFFAFASLGLGRLLQNRASLIALLEREQEDRTSAALALERQQIARELHDVVSHAMSMMLIQAGAARRLVPRDPAAAEGALLNVEAAGRGALQEMRRLLGVLSSAGDENGLEPTPNLTSIPKLVERVRAAGQPVEIEIEADVESVPPGVALAAYRVVQEGLTNVVKHAGGAAALVRIHCLNGNLNIEVTDCGPGSADPKLKPGHGLWGMHERVRLYGGSVKAVALTEGGFRVTADIPFQPS